ncbi:MAG: hypothetical protein U0166_02910 [Acidobacteriota bacterium]
MIRLDDLTRRLRCALWRREHTEILPELYELPAEVREALRRIELREPIYVAVRVLSARGLAAKVAEALDGSTEWFPAFVRLLDLGEREGVWRIEDLDADAHGDLAMVRGALAAEGTGAVLGVHLARQIVVRGEDGYREARVLVESWLGSERERALPGEQSRAAERASPEARAAAPVAGGGMRLISAAELLALNVNQHTGSRLIYGWFEPGKYLFLLRGTLPVSLLGKLTDLGLFLEAWEGKPAGPGLQFRIRAGERTFGGVLAVDLPALEAVVGEGWREVEASWRRTRYPVTEVIGMGHSESVIATTEPTDLPCPRCRGKKLVRKEKDGVYFLCEDGKCGFSVNAGDDGAPLPPDACEKCGEKRYQTMQKGKKVMKHVHPCKQARAA